MPEKRGERLGPENVYDLLVIGIRFRLHKRLQGRGRRASIEVGPRHPVDPQCRRDGLNTYPRFSVAVLM